VSEFKDQQTKLGAARTRLILERPFVGTLVMHLPLIAADPAWCKTVATDARAFYFNPGFIASLDLAETQFVLAHEALHCALGHFARRAHRERRRWDIATDHAVNLLLVDDGLKALAGALLNPEFRGLAAEDIYPLIPAQAE
jgi:predicted metal-dependent peptidase